MSKRSPETVTVRGSSIDRSTDEFLVKRLRTGDSAAFETLYRRYYEPLWEFAYRYSRSREGAEDLVHDVYHTLWERRAMLDVRVSLRQYLFGAVRNLALKAAEHQHVVRASASRVSGYEAAGVSPGPDVPDAAIEASEIAETLDRILADMPEMRRQVLILRWRSGLSYEEIAATLSISVQAAQAHVSRAQRAARPLLQRLFGPR